MLLIIGILAALVAIFIITTAITRYVHYKQFNKRISQRDHDQVHYAFIINPSKPQAEQCLEQIHAFCREKNLTQIEYIETTPDKDGKACALQALENGADVVIAVGGDGTVRTVASALSNTQHALGIIPIGTGNLFARNMGIPLDDIHAALVVATSHGSRRVDMGRLTLLDEANDREINYDKTHNAHLHTSTVSADYNSTTALENTALAAVASSHTQLHAHAFLIIAGIGFDAMMINDTSPELKNNISWLAYFVSGFKHLFTPKFHGTFTIKTADGNVHIKRDLTFRTFMAGNCGQIPLFTLMPDAIYDDGLLDFAVVDTQGGLIGWAHLFGNVVHQTVTGKTRKNTTISANSTVEHLQGVSAQIVLDKPTMVQVDGDTLGKASHIRFTIEHQALCVRVPEHGFTPVSNNQ